MGAVKDTYDIIKDLIKEAKKLKNYEFVERAIDIQQRFFDLNSENQDLKNKVKELNISVNELTNKQKDFEVLRKENAILQEKLTSIIKSNDLSFLDSEITTHYTEYRMIYVSGMKSAIKNTIKEIIKDIFYFVAPKLLAPVEDSKFSELFNKSVNGTYSYLDSKIVGQLKAKFLEHKLIEIKETPKQPTKIQLTEFGQEVLNKINAL